MKGTKAYPTTFRLLLASAGVLFAAATLTTQWILSSPAIALLALAPISLVVRTAKDTSEARLRATLTEHDQATTAHTTSNKAL